MARLVADVAGRTTRPRRPLTTRRPVLVAATRAAPVASVVASALSGSRALLSWAFGAYLDTDGLASYLSSVECASGVLGIARVVVQYELRKERRGETRSEEQGWEEAVQRREETKQTGRDEVRRAKRRLADRWLVAVSQAEYAAAGQGRAECRQAGPLMLWMLEREL